MTKFCNRPNFPLSKLLNACLPSANHRYFHNFQTIFTKLQSARDGLPGHFICLKSHILDSNATRYWSFGSEGSLDIWRVSLRPLRPKWPLYRHDTVQNMRFKVKTFFRWTIPALSLQNSHKKSLHGIALSNAKCNYLQNIVFEILSCPPFPSLHFPL